MKTAAKHKNSTKTEKTRLRRIRRISTAPAAKPVPVHKTDSLDPLGRYARRAIFAPWSSVEDGKGKKKIAFVKIGVRASVDAPSTWLTAEEAASLFACGNFDGVSILLGDRSDGSILAGIDVDTCRDPSTGTYDPWAEDIFKEIDTYFEVSPSGTGVKAFLRIAKEEREAALKLIAAHKTGRRGVIFNAPGKDPHPPSIGLFLGKRYFTVTLDHVEGTRKNVRIVPVEKLAWLVQHAGPALRGSSSSSDRPSDKELSARGNAALEKLRAHWPPLPNVVDLLNGEVDMLGADTSRSARDFALVRYCKAAGLSEEDAAAAVFAFPHGAGHEKHVANDHRYFKRLWANCPASAPARDTRAAIILEPGNLDRAIDEAEAALLAANLDLFRRGDMLVEPVRVDVPVAGGGQVITTRLRQVTSTGLAEAMSKSARFVRVVRGSESTVDCPPLVASTYLARANSNLPRLVGVIHAPTMRPDGTVLSTPGYDAATGLLFKLVGPEIPPIPENPTHDDAKTAFKRLKRVLRGFPFETVDDEAVAVSAILTALARPSLPTAPLHAITAPSAGTGKSLLVDISAIVSTGSSCPVASQGGSQEESEKRLATALIAGDPVFSFDNCTNSLNGDLLCQALTQEVINARILGKSKNAMCPVCMTMFATGNNLKITGDLTRRTILCSMDAKIERPELRTFKFDARVYTRTHRGSLIVAALTILRAYAVAGYPDHRKKVPLGSFEVWSKTLRDAIIWSGGGDPCATMEKVRNSDPEREAMISLMNAWKKVIGPKKITIKTLVKKVGANAAGDGIEDLREALLLVAGEGVAINNRRLGTYLSKNQNKVIDGRQFVKGTGRSGSFSWALVEVGKA